MSTHFSNAAMPMAFTESEKDAQMKEELAFIANNFQDHEALEKFRTYLECQKLVYELRQLRPRRRPNQGEG